MSDAKSEAMTKIDQILSKLDALAAEVAALKSSRGAPASRANPASGSGGAVFPNYGRCKAQPIRGAAIGDLEFYANGARRTLADPSRAQWHDKERALLDAIEAEIARQGGDAAPPEDAPF